MLPQMYYSLAFMLSVSIGIEKLINFCILMDEFRNKGNPYYESFIKEIKSVPLICGLTFILHELFYNHLFVD